MPGPRRGRFALDQSVYKFLANVVVVVVVPVAVVVAVAAAAAAVAAVAVAVSMLWSEMEFC